MAGEFFAKGGIITPSLDVKPSGNGAPLVIRNSTGTEVLTYKTNDKTVELWLGPPGKEMTQISIPTHSPGTTGYSNVSYVNGQLCVFERQVSVGIYLSISSDDAKTMGVPFKLVSGNKTIRDSIYYKNLYIFAGYDTIVYSPDLKSWNLGTIPAGTDVRQLRIAKNGTLVGFGHSGDVYVTGDGKSWTKRTIPASTSGAWYQGSGFMPNGDLWYVCGDGKIYTSADGITWSSQFNSKPKAKQHCQGPDGKITVFVQESAGVVDVYSVNSSFSVYTKIDTFSANATSNSARISGNFMAYTLEARGKHVTSIDGGSTWKMETDFPASPVNSIAVYPGTVVYQFDDATTFELRYKGSGNKVSSLSISDVALTTDLPQGSSPNSLVRKDYADSVVQIQVDGINAAADALATKVKDIQDSTFDYGEF